MNPADRKEYLLSTKKQVSIPISYKLKKRRRFMKFKNYSFIIVFVFCFILITCAPAQKEELDLGQVRQALEKQNIIYKEAVLQGDASAAAAVYTEDATLMPPDSEMVQGREAIEEFWRTEWTLMRVTDFNLTIVDLYGSGDIVYELGKYTIKIQLEGQEPIEDNGKFLVISKRTADGSWKWHVDIWNSSMPAQ